LLPDQLDLATATAIAVPTVLAADDSKTLLPQNILVLTKLEGDHVLSILNQLDDDELAAISSQIGPLLRVLHESASRRSAMSTERGLAVTGLLDFENVLAGDQVAGGEAWPRRSRPTIEEEPNARLPMASAEGANPRARAKRSEGQARPRPARFPGRAALLRLSEETQAGIAVCLVAAAVSASLRLRTPR